MSALVIARLAVLRFLRDRSNVFFVFVLPLALVLLLGLQFGGGDTPVLAVVAPDDAAARGLTDVLAERSGIEGGAVCRPGGGAGGRGRGRGRGGPGPAASYREALASGRATVQFVTRPDGGGGALHPVVAEAVGRQGADATAVAVAAEITGRPRAELASIAEAVAPGAMIGVERVDVEGERLAGGLAEVGRFEAGASSQLVLFVFITSLAAAAALIQERNLGLTTRMLATPTRSREVVLGTALGRFGIALFQGGYIMLGALVVFGVDWGDPVGAVAVLVVFSAVSAGAGLLLGVVADNDVQAGGIGVGLGLGLAARGGSMVPLEVFPETMRRIALVTPHAWANRAFADLVRRGQGLTAVLPELAVLVAMAALLLAVAGWRLRAATAA